MNSSLNRKKDCRDYIPQTVSFQVSRFPLMEKNLPKSIRLSQKKHAVPWLTTVNNEWANDETVNTVFLYKIKEDECEQLNQHLKVKRKYIELLVQKKIDKIKLRIGNSSRSHRFSEMRNESTTMWYGYSNWAVAAKHRILLTKPDWTQNIRIRTRKMESEQRRKRAKFCSKQIYDKLTQNGLCRLCSRQRETGLFVMVSPLGNRILASLVTFNIFPEWKSTSTP